MRITQTGLPEGDRIEVKVSDPAPTTRELASITTRSGPGGTIDVALRFSLRGHSRLHVEVEDLDRHAEYGETGTDLGSRCEGRHWTRVAVAGAGLALLTTAVWVGMRRRRRPRHRR